jgi:hypothetical protein
VVVAQEVLQLVVQEALPATGDSMVAMETTTTIKPLVLWQLQ